MTDAQLNVQLIVSQNLYYFDQIVSRCCLCGGNSKAMLSKLGHPIKKLEPESSTFKCHMPNPRKVSMQS